MEAIMVYGVKIRNLDKKSSFLDGGINVHPELLKKDLESIHDEVKREFPGDPALQQIHLARKIIAMEARSKEMTFGEYIRSQRR